MKVEVANVSEIERRMTVEVAAESVTREIEKAYQDLKKNVRLRGFRPGKAPLSLLQKYFKAQVEEDVISKLVQDTYPQALEQESIQPVSQPKIENGVLETGRDFSYTAVVEITPEIDVKDYTGIKIETIKTEATDADVNEELERYRGTCATMNEITDRPTRMGDHVLFDFEGLMGDEAYLGGKKTDYFLELGQNMLLPGFDEQLVGLALGEKKEFTLTIADDYGDKEIAGKAIAFTVELKNIKEKIKPELNDDFAKDIGEYASLADLKSKVRESIGDRKKKQAEADVKEQIFTALIEKNAFEVPKGMVDMQARNMLMEIQRMFQAQGLDMEDMGQNTAQLFEQYKQPAERQVRSALLLEAVARKEHLEPEDADYEKKYEEFAKRYGQDLETIKSKVDKEMLKPQVMERKAIDFIISKAELTEN